MYTTTQKGLTERERPKNMPVERTAMGSSGTGADAVFSFSFYGADAEQLYRRPGVSVTMTLPELLEWVSRLNAMVQRAAGHCACGHVLDCSTDERCRHCAKASPEERKRRILALPGPAAVPRSSAHTLLGDLVAKADALLTDPLDPHATVALVASVERARGAL